MMICEKCGKNTCIIHIISTHEKICDECHAVIPKVHPIDGIKCKEVIDNLIKENK